MKLHYYITLVFFSLFITLGKAQEKKETTKKAETVAPIVKGKVLNAKNNSILENVNILNLNQIKGTATTKEGLFQIAAKVNDTLYLSYLGFETINVRVTEDWLKFGDVTISMTEKGIALDEVTVTETSLTGFLEIDAKRAPIYATRRQDEIRNLLQSKYDRETLMNLLQLDKVDIDAILRNCQYSKQFIETANDLQILDAISECYEEYKVLKTSKDKNKK